ncbi:MAG TPA: polymer-forming cytoskeletal protein [Gemmatimonadales bacterium]|jgi:cytoskeletal protein CcmA (bactofilin family)|nr:polymer-forming cytoskeletal protein [Gemmatimonadales bacterium]
MALFTEKGAGMGGGESVAGLSIIGGGMRVVGDIEADGVVKIEGTVVGTVRAAKQVLVAKGGEVEGDVVSREAIVGGEVRGGIYAEERVELQATSVVHGDISTRKLFVQEGGEINGVLRMGEDAGQPPESGKRAARQAASSTF